MTCLLVRYLCLACSVLLVFPPHWCCRAQPAETSAAAPAPQKSCCAHKHSLPPNETPKTPTPLRPTDSELCPCCERSSLIVDDSAKILPDVVPSVPYFALPTILAAISYPDSEAASLVVLPPRLHLFQCVWRC
jgi:hypothetical protein